jgi:uncharacterized protein (DUF342 family)
VLAARSVECGTLGSQAGEVRTQVHVGVDPFASAAIEDYDRRCRETRIQVSALGERGKLLAHAIDKSAREDDAGIAAIVDLRALLQQRSRLEAKIGQWERALVELRHRVADPAAAARAAVVVVTGYAHGGVEVVIGDTARLLLTEPLPRPRFHLDQTGLIQI